MTLTKEIFQFGIGIVAFALALFAADIIYDVSGLQVERGQLAQIAAASMILTGFFFKWVMSNEWGATRKGVIYGALTGVCFYMILLWATMG